MRFGTSRADTGGVIDRRAREPTATAASRSPTIRVRVAMSCGSTSRTRAKSESVETLAELRTYAGQVGEIEALQEVAFAAIRHDEHTGRRPVRLRLRELHRELRHESRRATAERDGQPRLAPERPARIDSATSSIVRPA